MPRKYGGKPGQPMNRATRRPGGFQWDKSGGNTVAKRTGSRRSILPTTPRMSITVTPRRSPTATSTPPASAPASTPASTSRSHTPQGNAYGYYGIPNDQGHGTSQRGKPRTMRRAKGRK